MASRFSPCNADVHASGTQVAVIVERQNIAYRHRRLRAMLVQQADGPLDDMAQLAGPLVRPLQDSGCSLQMITREHIGWKHLLLLGKAGMTQNRLEIGVR